MPVAQIDPPGGLAWHVPLVAAAPALLAVAAGWAAAIAPPGRWRQGLGWGGMAAALLLAAVALRPDGAAAAFAGTPVAHGWMRMTPLAAALALAAGALAAWRWRAAAPAGWGWRVGAGLLLPLTAAPLLAAAVEADAGAPRRAWRLALAGGGTLAAIWLPGWAAMAVVLPAIAALLPAGQRTWVAILGCAAIAGLPEAWR